MNQNNIIPYSRRDINYNSNSCDKRSLNINTMKSDYKLNYDREIFSDKKSVFYQLTSNRNIPLSNNSNNRICINNRVLGESTEEKTRNNNKRNLDNSMTYLKNKLKNIKNQIKNNSLCPYNRIDSKIENGDKNTGYLGLQKISKRKNRLKLEFLRNNSSNSLSNNITISNNLNLPNYSNLSDNTNLNTLVINKYSNNNIDKNKDTIFNSVVNTKKSIKLTNINSNNFSSNNNNNVVNNDKRNTTTNKNKQVNKSTANRLKSNILSSLNINGTNRTNKIKNTTAGKNSNQEYIVSIIENYAREIGISVFNITTSEMFITQIIDNEAYINTITLVNYWYPIEIVLNEKHKNSSLDMLLKKIFVKTNFHYLPRKSFNESFGKTLYLGSQIQELSFEEVNKKYVCMASLSGLINQLEMSNISLNKSLLYIKYHYLENHLNISYQSVISLELLFNSQFKTKDLSLISLFKTKTISGYRLLRSNILQPFSNISDLNDRYDAIEELISNNRFNSSDILDLRKNLIELREFEIHINKFMKKYEFNDNEYNTDLKDRVLKKQQNNKKNGFLSLTQKLQNDSYKMNKNNLKNNLNINNANTLQGTKLYNSNNKSDTNLNDNNNPDFNYFEIKNINQNRNIIEKENEKQNIQLCDKSQNKLNNKLNEAKEESLCLSFSNIKQMLISLKYLKDSFSLIIDSSLITILSKYQSKLLVQIKECFEYSILSELIEKLKDSLEDFDITNKQVINKVDFVFYMIKPGTDNMYDTIQLTYSDTIRLLHKEFEKTKEEFNLPPHVKLSYAESKGYYFSISESFYKEEFNFAIAKKMHKGYHCSTASMISLSERLDELKKELTKCCLKILGKLIQYIQANISYLFIVSSNIALLDVILALADYAKSNSQKVVRPIVYINSKSDYNANEIDLKNNIPLISRLQIINAFNTKHPILEQNNQKARIHINSTKCQTVSNDFFINSNYNIFLIKGPNASGKTTMMKQLALLIILSQLGSYVPADYFEFSPLLFLYSKFKSDNVILDNIFSTNSIINEVLDIQKLLNGKYSNSLMLFDEPFENTTDKESLALSLAVFEKISNDNLNNCFIISSHNHTLCSLVEKMFNVFVGLMKAEFTSNKVDFFYKLVLLNPLKMFDNSKEEYINTNNISDKNLFNQEYYMEDTSNFKDNYFRKRNLSNSSDGSINKSKQNKINFSYNLSNITSKISNQCLEECLEIVNNQNVKANNTVLKTSELLKSIYKNSTSEIKCKLLTNTFEEVNNNDYSVLSSNKQENYNEENSDFQIIINKNKSLNYIINNLEQVSSINTNSHYKENYGIYLASMIGFNKDIIDSAQKLFIGYKKRLINFNIIYSSKEIQCLKISVYDIIRSIYTLNYYRYMLHEDDVMLIKRNIKNKIVNFLKIN